MTTKLVNTLTCAIFCLWVFFQGNVAELGERLNKCGLTESTCDANIRRISALLDGQYLPLSEEDIKWLRNARQIMLDIGRFLC